MIWKNIRQWARLKAPKLREWPRPKAPICPKNYKIIIYFFKRNTI